MTGESALKVPALVGDMADEMDVRTPGDINGEGWLLAALAGLCCVGAAAEECRSWVGEVDEVMDALSTSPTLFGGASLVVRLGALLFSVPLGAGVV